MAENNNDNPAGPVLSPEELSDVREQLKERDRRRWLGDIIKRWAQWLAAVALGVTVLWDWLHKIITHFGTPR